MAEYTTQLRNICESLSGNVPGEYHDVSTIIETARPKIFNFYFPIFNESYRSVLETKILRHYYTREIGQETYGLWKLRLETKLLEIMPYYNLLYESNNLKYDILNDYYVERTHKGGREENTSGKEESTTNRTGQTNVTENGNTTLQTSGTDSVTFHSTGFDDRAVTNDTDTTTKNTTIADDTDTTTTETAFSDTPQGSLSGVDKLQYLTSFTSVNATDKKGIDQEESGTQTVNSSGSDNLQYQRDDTTDTTYGKKDTNSITRTQGTTSSDAERGNSTRSGNLTSTDQYIEVVQGKMGGRLYPEMIQAYRDSLLNIDLMIIKDLKDLFILIY